MLRFFLILGSLLRYGFRYSLIRTRMSSDKPEVLLRQFFEDIGGSFIKFGQILAMRIDILPKEYVLELLDLFDNLSPFPYHELESVFISELGNKPEHIFEWFDKTPLAAASFGQVHRARLKTGEDVVVKVLRPGIRDLVRVDFVIVDIAAFLGDLFFRIDALPWKEIAAEFKKYTLAELDYRKEVVNIQTIRANVRNSDYIVIPNVYPYYCTGKILVEDYINGISLTSILRRIKQGTLDYDRLEGVGIDIKEIPSILIQELLEEFLVHNLFHADPHPGNILLLPGNRIGLIDFGIVGSTHQSDKGYIVRFAHATAKFEFREATYHFAHIAGNSMRQIVLSALPASADPKVGEDVIKILASDFGEYAHSFVHTNVERLKNMQMDYAGVILQLLKAAQKYHIRLPSEAIVFFRGLSILGFMAKELDYDFMMSDEVKHFFHRYPEDLFPIEKPKDEARIKRELALEKLQSWLAHLLEIDPELYTLVRNRIYRYNSEEFMSI